MAGTSMSKVITYEGEFGGRKLILEKGVLAQQANSAVRVQYGDTVVLASITCGVQQREGVDYLPLMVDYEEKMYAAGKIKGSRFIKREGRPTDEAIVVSRLIDRALRPLFDQKIRNDLQIVVSVLSLDPQANPHIAAVIAAAAALATSGIPTVYGPIGVAQIAEKDSEILINPGHDDLAGATLALLVTGTESVVNMIEMSGIDVPEGKLNELIGKTHVQIQECLKQIKAFRDKCGEIKPVEMIYEADLLPAALKQKIEELIKDKLEEALFEKERAERQDGLKVLWAEVLAKLGTLEAEVEKLAHNHFNSLVDIRARHAVSVEDRRVDGRKMNELRPIDCRIALLPRTHGSALFNRGLTQALSIVTLGAPGDEQLLDSMEEDGTKRFIHHYNFPPFCSGEVAPMRGPGRREIGHGALAEKALAIQMPDKAEFPYTIRMVTEILSSNGSTSMASVCASSLALMDAGVPIKKASAGIAMGIIFSEDKKGYRILTDIQGLEDHGGDMDFKVAGTDEGITALQLDVKMEGLSLDLFPEVLRQAKAARLEILAKMNQVISSPRKDLSPYAPRIVTIQINPDKIRDVIGPGGKTINAIINDTGVDIDIEDSGLVMVTSVDKEAMEKAVEWINNLTREVKVGEQFEGRITRIMEFGAFAEVLPGQEGLIHVSEIAPFHVDRVNNYLKVGQVVPVKVIEIDEVGRINLSCKNLIKLEPKPGQDRGPVKKFFNKYKKKGPF